MDAVDLGLDLTRLQGQRLAHAVMEAGVTLALPSTEEANLRYAAEVGFPTAYALGATDAARARAGFDHSAPSTYLGDETRPLIFSRAFLDKAKSTAETRDLRYTFAGLVTPSRRAAFDAFAAAADERLPDLDAVTAKIKRRIAGYRDQPASFKSRSGKTIIWYSRRGRDFPIKLWDQDYFTVLGRSQFVLCPNGVHVWSYRFFEAAMAGAIPVVEETTPCYEGFRYRTMADPDIGTAVWHAEDSAHNVALAAERLTLPAARIRELVAG